MKTMFLLTCLFFTVCSLSAQNESVGVPLSPGDTFAYGGKEVKFVRVLSDSRCPTGVTCIWAGNAVVLVEIFEKGKRIGEKEIEISAAGRSLPFQIFEDVSLLVHSLLPYPEAADHTEDRKYLLQLQVQPN